MELLCPECLNELTVMGADTARCPVDGGQYQILFTRRTARVSAVPGGAVSGGFCGRHQAVPAAFACGHCGGLICATCAFPQPDGQQLCPDCAPLAASGVVRLSPAPVLAGVMCARHPHVPAVRECKVCHAPVCATCDFTFPGDVHLCPGCASAPAPALSRRRRRNLVWAYVMAVWTTLGLGVLFSGVLQRHVNSEQEQNGLGALLFFFILIPSIAGTALSVSALDRRLQNPSPVWAAVIWNGLVLAVLLLLMTIGTLQ